MSDPYLSDKLKPLFKMVVWNARKNEEQKERVFAAAMKHIEDAGQITDTEVVRVIDTYARQFAEAGLGDEADQLAKLAASIKQSLPGRFSTGGRELEWWEQSDFRDSMPKLPWQIKASRVQAGAGGGVGGFLCLCGVLFIVLGIPYSFIIQPLLKTLRLDEGIPALIFLLSLPAGAWAIYRWQGSKLAQKSRESWCKFTDDGVEFHEPGNAGKIAWSEVKNVWCDFAPSADDDSSYDVTEIVGSNNKKIRLSAQFYTEQEVKTVYGICKLRSR